MSSKIHKKVALVTGASSGIGEATAQHLLAAGYEVYGTSRNGTHPSGNPGFRLLALDVTRDDSVQSTVATVLKQSGKLDLLVNNAGFGIAPAAAEESSMAQAQSVFETNFFGLVRTTRAVLPHMRRQGGGRIINIGSVLGFLPVPFNALYAASKHAVEGYSESLDHEVRNQGIRVTVIEPAFTKTNFESNAIEPDAKLDDYEEIRAALMAHLPTLIDKGDHPDTVAATVLKAAQAARPKLRYTAGAAAGRLKWLRAFAPVAWVDAGVRKDMLLD